MSRPPVRQARGRPRRGALVLLALLLPGLAGCAALTSRPNAARTGEIRPAVEVEQARAVWDDFLVAREADPRKGKAKAAAQRLGGAFAGTSLVLERAVLALDRATKAKRSSTAVEYADPEIYVPLVFGYPKWFAVRAQARVPGVAGGDDTEQVRYLVFTRARAGAAWRQEYEAGVPKALAKAVPSVLVAENGLAETVPLKAPGTLVLAPAQVPAAWAGTVTSDRADKSAPVAGETYRKRRLADRDGDVLGLGESTAVQYAAEPRAEPPYALRTVDGGALVLFATDDVRTYRPAEGAPAGLKIAVTGDYAVLSGKTQLRTMTVTRLDQWLAVVPVGEGAVQVVGQRSALLDVTGKP